MADYSSAGGFATSASSEKYGANPETEVMTPAPRYGPAPGYVPQPAAPRPQKAKPPCFTWDWFTHKARHHLKKMVIVFVLVSYFATSWGSSFMGWVCDATSDTNILIALIIRLCALYCYASCAGTVVAGIMIGMLDPVHIVKKELLIWTIKVMFKFMLWWVVLVLKLAGLYRWRGDQRRKHSEAAAMRISAQQAQAPMPIAQAVPVTDGIPYAQAEAVPYEEPLPAPSAPAYSSKVQ